ncbi:N-acetyltransferase [Mucilaginibacter terrenus]|uniref:N-acetyltransferase n=1 Tax=Mucilaginibacter terrenus TaxID=2482727 RepID=A0A3E2NK51_9SPHI|nr:GNAT family protein [Mucilaginibacter terrenus]RFZ81377.1 N-acetyltransferase [Mucilaginibacter terrenus]
MELKDGKVLLRRLRPEDAATLQMHADDEGVSAYLKDRFPYPYTIEDAEFFINLKMNEDPQTVYAIDTEGEFAGMIGLDLRQDVYCRTPLIGYWLGRTYWGAGIATTAVKLLTSYAFNQLDMICIQAFVFSENPASMRVLEKAGYQKQGILKGSVIKRSRIMDEHVYAAYPQTQ